MKTQLYPEAKSIINGKILKPRRKSDNWHKENGNLGG